MGAFRSKWQTLLLSFVVTTFLVEGSFAGEVFDPGTFAPQRDQFAFVVSNTAVPAATLLSVQPPGVDEIGVRGEWLNCYSTLDPACALNTRTWSGPGDQGVIGWSVLPICDSQASENCIEKFEISYDGANFADAKFLRTLAGGLSIPSDPTFNYVGGGTTSIWDDSTLANSKKQSYMTNFIYSSFYDPSTKKFNVSNISLSIVPIKEVSGAYKAPVMDRNLPANNRISFGPRGSVWSEDGVIGVATDFPSTSKFRLTVRSTNQVTGWFKARLKDPAIDIKKYSEDNNKVVIEGEPVSVPTFVYTKFKSEFNTKENKWWQNNGQSNSTTGAGADQQDIFEYLDYFRPLVNDRAAGFNTLWTVNSTNWGNQNKCLMDPSRVVGIVSTNAMGFNGNSPSYKDGTLNYQVAGMHYMPDGKSLVEGTYDLLIRSDAARCLYGFSNAPIQASISVTGEADQKVATTSMTEGNGWIKLSAYGFTFSDPTISVKLSQAKSQEKVQANVQVKKSSTITCKKGKITKKVTGESPKCPAGYKKR